MRSIIILIFLSFVSCSDDNDEGFTIPIEEYLGSDLKIDGYYLHEREDGESSEGYIFYTSGIFFRQSQRSDSHIQTEFFEQLISDTEHMNKVRGVVDHWGLYNIDLLTKDIIIQYRVQPFSGGLNLVERMGNILNDSTFMIEDETYSFKHFPKPDSLNSFVP